MNGENRIKEDPSHIQYIIGAAWVFFYLFQSMLRPQCFFKRTLSNKLNFFQNSFSLTNNFRFTGSTVNDG